MAKLPAKRTNPHEPYQLNTSNKRSHIIAEVKKGIRDGLDVEDAFLNAGIPRDTYRRWKRELKEDIRDGFTGTGLMKVFFEVAKEDIALHRKLRKQMFAKAEEGDTKMMIYLEDNRFGAANKRKNNIELGSSEKGNTTINIVNMKGVETDESEEQVEIEVNGRCRDDSNSTEMD